MDSTANFHGNASTFNYADGMLSQVGGRCADQIFISMDPNNSAALPTLRQHRTMK
jgi:hypothetical protein